MYELLLQNMIHDAIPKTENVHTMCFNRTFVPSFKQALVFPKPRNVMLPSYV